MIQMSDKLRSSDQAFKVFVMPRQDEDFFKVGRLYHLKFDDFWKHGVDYTIFDVKKISNEKDFNPYFFNINYPIQYNMEPNFVSHKSYKLNKTFICLESDVNILRNFSAMFDGKKIDVSIMKKIPVFLFHDKITNKQIIGAVQIDISRAKLNSMFGDKLPEIQTSPGIVYIENFFEKVI